MSLPSRLEGFEYRGCLFLSGPTGDKEGHSQLSPEARLALAFTKLVQRPRGIFTLQLWHSPARPSAFHLQAFTPKKAMPLGEWQSHHWALEPEVGPPSAQTSWRQGVQVLRESLFTDRDCEVAESRGETSGVQLGEDKDFRDAF